MVAVDRLTGLSQMAAIKAPCRVVATSNITLSGLQSIDSVTVAADDRVLVTAQTDGTENGIYTVDSGDWTRAPDFDGTGDALKGTIVVVTSGTAYSGTVWQLTTTDPDIETDSLSFSIMGTGALAGVSAFIQTLLDDSTAAVARTTLGAVGLTGNETVAGNKTFTGTIDLTGAAVTVATATAGDNDTSAASTAFVQAAITSQIGATVIRSYLAGLALSAAGGTATFGIAAGVAADGGNAAMMSLGSAYTKTTSAWAVGTGNGALDTGAIANSTWYHVWLIKRSDTGVVDVLVSTSASSPTMPTNYDLKRRIGSMKTDGSAQWVKFIQSGDLFQWDALVADVADTNPGTSLVTKTLTVPTGVNVLAEIIVDPVFATTGGAKLYIHDLSVSDEAASTANGFVNSTSAVGGQAGGWRGDIRTNTSGQIGYRLSGSGASDVINITTAGWRDTRGRDA